MLLRLHAHPIRASSARPVGEGLEKFLAGEVFGDFALRAIDTSGRQAFKVSRNALRIGQCRRMLRIIERVFMCAFGTAPKCADHAENAG